MSSVKATPTAAPNENGWTPLHYAVRHGLTGKTTAESLTDVEQALAVSNLEINHHVNKSGDTALHFLVQCPKQGSEELLQRLLRLEGIDVNSRNSQGYDTPLHLVCQVATWSSKPFVFVLIQQLLEAGAKVDLTCKYDRSTPLHMVAPSHECYAENASKVVSILLEAGADVKAQNELGETPLHLTRSTQVARILLDAKGGIDCMGMTDQTKNTPLHRCFLYENTEEFVFEHPRMIKLLIQAGADIHRPNAEGRKAADLIRRTLDYEMGALESEELHQMLDFIQTLLPVLNEKLSSKWNPASVYGEMMWLTAQQGYCLFDDHLNELLDLGADVNYVHPKSGFTVLHHLLNSCRDKYDESYGRAQDAMWTTSFDYTIEGNHEDGMEGFALEVLNRLVQARPSIKVDGVTKDGKSLLHYAAVLGYVRVAERLMELSVGALDINSTDNKGFAPLHVACQRRHSAMVKWLIERDSLLLATTSKSGEKKGQTTWEIASESGQSALPVLKDSNVVRSHMKDQAQKVLHMSSGLSSRLLERLLRTGPVGISLAFELMPLILAAERTGSKAGNKRPHSEV